jgi:hypothetical protein
VLKSRGKTALLAMMVALCSACAARNKPASQVAPGQNSQGELRSIEGRIAYLVLGTTPEGYGDGGNMKLVTAQGDTFLLIVPSKVRCKPGTTSDIVGFGGGTTMRVYLKPHNLELARTEYVTAEWAEVECISRRP